MSTTPASSNLGLAYISEDRMFPIRPLPTTNTFARLEVSERDAIVRLKKGVDLLMNCFPDLNMSPLILVNCERCLQFCDRLSDTPDDDVLQIPLTSSFFGTVRECKFLRMGVKES